MIYILGRIPEEIFNVKDPEKRRLLFFALEICKRRGIGKRLPKQRVEYSSLELKILKKIGKFLLWFYENECKNVRSLKETEEIISTLIISLKENRKILFFALFCPGYKKGKEVYGFNVEIGNTTKKGLANLYSMYRKAKSLKILVEVLAIYSDLALENFRKLSIKEINNLQKNYKTFKQYGQKKFKEIKIVKLSEVGNCKKSIGYGGILKGKIELCEKEIDNIKKRSLPFYKNILGWKEKDIKKRTKDLARSCSMIAQEIRKKNPLLIKIMTESIYERGKFYQASKENKFLPIFYPKNKFQR